MGLPLPAWGFPGQGFGGNGGGGRGKGEGVRGCWSPAGTSLPPGRPTGPTPSPPGVSPGKEFGRRGC